MTPTSSPRARRLVALGALCACALAAAPASGASSFTLFETGQVRPLAHADGAAVRGQHARQSPRDLRRRPARR